MPPCRFTAGIDASDFDWSRGPMDLAAAVRDGIVFFTHKASEGTRVQHARYGEAMARAQSAVVPFMGAYVVPRTPGNNGHGTVRAQVNYFLSYLDRHTPWWRGMREFFLQVDLEHWGYDDVPPWVGVEMCRILRAETGKWVVLYAPRWAYGDSIPNDGTPLWASAYGRNPAVPYRQAYPGDGSSGWAPYSGRTPTFLQYGSRLRIGSQPGCDANAYRGSLDQLRALVTGNTTTMEVPDVQLSDLMTSSRSGPTSVDNALLTTLDDVHMDIAPAVRRIEEALTTLASGPTDEQIDRQADRIAQKLIADGANPLSDAHLAATREAVKQVLREGVGGPDAPATG